MKIRWPFVRRSRHERVVDKLEKAIESMVDEVRAEAESRATAKEGFDLAVENLERQARGWEALVKALVRRAGERVTVDVAFLRKTDAEWTLRMRDIGSTPMNPERVELRLTWGRAPARRAEDPAPA